jgi:AcrR family transcriptional regulator
MNPSVLDTLDLPGVTLPRQSRSRALMLTLMERALEMLRTRSFDQLAIAKLCAAAGCTAGSFYARFESKDAFLRALQHAVVTDSAVAIRARVEAPRFRNLPLDGMVARIVEGAVRWNRRYEGLSRASLRATDGDPNAWAPLRDLGRVQSSLSVPLLLERLAAERGRPAAAADEERVRFAFLVLFGTLNNIVLVNPGPYGLHDAETPRLLSETLLRLIADG